MILLSTLQVSKAVNANQHSHMSGFAEMSYLQPLRIWTDLSVLAYGPLDKQHLGYKTDTGNEHLERCMPSVNNEKNVATPTLRLKK